eukprot:scaffold17367_cov48-Phaeocystis_antarctica.AAC.1
MLTRKFSATSPPPAAATGGAAMSPDSLRPRKFRPERGQQPPVSRVNRAKLPPPALPPNAAPAPSTAVAVASHPPTRAAPRRASSTRAAPNTPTPPMLPPQPPTPKRFSRAADARQAAAEVAAGG